MILAKILLDFKKERASQTLSGVAQQQLRQKEQAQDELKNKQQQLEQIKSQKFDFHFQPKQTGEILYLKEVFLAALSIFPISFALYNGEKIQLRGQNGSGIVRTPKNQYNTDMSYPIHFRKKILAKLEEGQSIRAVAQHFEINKNTIVEWKKRIEIKRTRPRKPSKVDDDALRADVEQYPDDYQYERAARFGCGTSTIGDALKRLNITVKKRPYGTRKQKQNSESSI